MTAKDDEIILKEREFSNRKRNIARYFVMLLVCFIYAYLYGGFFPYTLLYLTLSLPIMSLLYLVVICTCFKLSERINERIFVKGSHASYHLILENSSPLYMPFITVRFYMDGQIICKNLKSLRISLAPLSKRELDYSIPLLFRGKYDVGVKSIQISDILGLFSHTIHSYEKKSILVKPRILDIQYDDSLSARISEGKLSYEYNEAGNDDISNIRDYAYGDSFRKIHWKLSSKFGKPLVKETRNELDNDAVIILNLNGPDTKDEEALLKEDCIIEEVVSQVNFLLKKNIPVKLCFFKDGPFTLRVSTPMEFQTFYMLLSELKFNQKKDFAEVLGYFASNEQSSNLMYLYSVELDGDALSKALQIENYGINIELFYISISDIERDDAEAYRNMADMLIKNNIRSKRLEPLVLEAGTVLDGAERDIGKMEAKIYGTQA
jgi:hypothetical protein